MKKLPLLLLAFLAGPLAAVPVPGPYSIVVLDPTETAAGGPARVALHTSSRFAPPARLFSVAVDGQEVRIGLLWPENLREVPLYEFVTLVDLPPLAAGTYAIRAFATTSPEPLPDRDTAAMALVVNDQKVELAYAGAGRASSAEEIPLLLSHRPCAGRLDVELEGHQILLRGADCWAAAPAGWPLQLDPLAPGLWKIEIEAGNQGIRSGIELEVLPAEVVLAGAFEVEIGWENAAGETGRGELVQAPSEDSALFYFFSPENWELMVKVLDGCTINGYYWVFGAASTDVAYTVDIRRRGTVQTFHAENSLGTAAPAIADVEAFLCDPDATER